MQPVSVGQEVTMKRTSMPAVERQARHAPLSGGCECDGIGRTGSQGEEGVDFCGGAPGGVREGMPGRGCRGGDAGEGMPGRGCRGGDAGEGMPGRGRSEIGWRFVVGLSARPGTLRCREGAMQPVSVGQEVTMKRTSMPAFERRARHAPLSGGCGGNGRKRGRRRGEGANGCADKIVQFGVCLPVNLS
jgi:hypothetical protein